MTGTVLITGANRGIGFEFTRQYAQDGYEVIACCRHPERAEELQALQKQHPKIQIHQIDVTSQAHIQDVKNKITQPIDIIINNAGVLPKESASFQDISDENIIEVFKANALGPFNVAQAFLDNLLKGKQKIIANVSSSMSSLAENASGGYYSYRTSKVALNMLMRSAGRDLAPLGVKVILLHPGWAQTRMGGERATVSAHDSVAGMRGLIAKYNPAPGDVVFYRYNGTLVAW